MLVCVHTCVCIISSIPLLFSEPWQQPASVLLSASDLSELCVRSKRACLSIYVHTRVSLYVTHSFAIPSRLCSPRRPPRPQRCHLLLSPRLLIQRFAVTTNYGLSCPVTSDPSFSSCLLHAKHRVKTKWPRLFVYFFPSYCSVQWSHTFPQELPSIQHLCALEYVEMNLADMGYLYNGKRDRYG